MMIEWRILVIQWIVMVIIQMGNNGYLTVKSGCLIGKSCKSCLIMLKWWLQYVLSREY